MDIRCAMGLFLLSFLPLVLSASQPQNNLTTPSYQISRKPCYVKGQEGTCMFVWECVKTEGTPLGMCMERFMFGSCCAHDLDNNVVPKPSLSSMIATMATNYPTPVGSPNVIGAAKPNNLPVSMLTTLIASIPTWKGNSTNETAPESEKIPSPGLPSLAVSNWLSDNTSTDSTLSNELTSTASPISHNTVTLSPSQTTTPLIIVSTTSVLASATRTPTPSTPAESTTKPQAMAPTNQALASAQPAPTIAPSLNLLIPNNLLNPIAVPVSSTAITKPQNSDVLVASPVPISHPSPLTSESNSTILTSAIELPDSPSSLNELNSTADIPITIPTASNQPIDDPLTNAHVTSGVTSTTEADSTESQSVPLNNLSNHTTTTTSSSIVASTAAASLASNEITDVTETATVSVTPSVQNTSTSTESSSKKPGTSVTPTSFSNSTSSTESTKKPTLAVTSLPSSYPEIECGVPPMLAEIARGERIVGGNNSKFGSWPWQVSVRRTSFFGFSSTHRCGGALLNELWVITAGHCVEDLLVSQIRMRMGEFDFSSVQEPYPFVERGVNKKIVHPKYNFFTYEYDLALVRLEEPITFQPNIAPICLPAMDESLIGQNGTVTGWGRLSEGGTLPSMLQQVTVPIVSNDKCKDMFLKAGRHEYIPDIFMCAGFEEGGRDSCQGDSGGPLQIRGRDGKYFLGGIISWGIGCAEANLPGVCTRISKFTSWILENVT
ncbi:serine proteinase stubble-like isoform X2 [Daphnia pulex]|uniref:serine proteinase stubble-like isoform X2 n=1 Tax=Daphnia pulex TaxID=6669 RepID=UPI001EDEE83C|nr:serine proteinase stubble-like isoform X2 [Daphnia pulex]XP_046453270.1 serine proteinase stubble-like isoform X2 [Daphnia pulex]